MNRFGQENIEVVRQETDQLTPANTKKSKASAWKQFTDFCLEKSYNFDREDISVEELGLILEDFGFNMRRKDGTNYKESVVKVLWNSTVKQLQEHFYKRYNRKFDPFSDVEFANARAARNAKRRQLQRDPFKRKVSASALSSDELQKIIELCDENTPEGLQKKLFYVASYELAWRGGEGASACIEYFIEETDNQGHITGRIEYNPVFSKTCQGGSKKITDSKWLIPNLNNTNICPVRLFKKFIEKRTEHIKTNRFFLTVNPNWNQSTSKGWYKNCPAGHNTVSLWFKLAASTIGIDTNKTRITNHSARATAVSSLARKGVGEQQIIKITGHANSQSIKPYMQLDVEHHQTLIETMRSIPNKTSAQEFQKQESSQSNIVQASQKQESSQPNIVYNNCVFHINNNYNSQNNI